ncbi:hypothetical protein DMC01_07040 [Campylobacter troglodytis]|nr:hypothetical protein DMC01_07040 [Campylobacter troglodytis]
MFGGILCAHFGHFIIESLARIWYVLQNPKDTRRIVFLLMPFGANEPKPWFSDFFRLLKLDEKRVFFVKKPTQFLHLTLRMRTHLTFLQQRIRLYL